MLQEDHLASILSSLHLLHLLLILGNQRLTSSTLTTRGLLGVNSVQNSPTSSRQPHHAVPKRSGGQGITAAKSVGSGSRGQKSGDRGCRGHAGEATLLQQKPFTK